MSYLKLRVKRWVIAVFVVSCITQSCKPRYSYLQGEDSRLSGFVKRQADISLIYKAFRTAPHIFVPPPSIAQQRDKNNKFLKVYQSFLEANPEAQGDYEAENQLRRQIEEKFGTARTPVEEIFDYSFDEGYPELRSYAAATAFELLIRSDPTATHIGFQNKDYTPSQFLNVLLGQVIKPWNPRIKEVRQDGDQKGKKPGGDLICGYPWECLKKVEHLVSLSHVLNARHHKLSESIKLIFDELARIALLPSESGSEFDRADQVSVMNALVFYQAKLGKAYAEFATQTGYFLGTPINFSSLYFSQIKKGRQNFAIKEKRKVLEIVRNMEKRFFTTFSYRGTKYITPYEVDINRFRREMLMEMAHSDPRFADLADDSYFLNLASVDGKTKVVSDIDVIEKQRKDESQFLDEAMMMLNSNLKMVGSVIRNTGKSSRRILMLLDRMQQKSPRRHIACSVELSRDYYRQVSERYIIPGVQGKSAPKILAPLEIGFSKTVTHGNGSYTCLNRPLLPAQGIKSLMPNEDAVRREAYGPFRLKYKTALQTLVGLDANLIRIAPDNKGKSRNFSPYAGLVKVFDVLASSAFDTNRSLAVDLGLDPAVLGQQYEQRLYESMRGFTGWSDTLLKMANEMQHRDRNTKLWMSLLEQDVEFLKEDGAMPKDEKLAQMFDSEWEYAVFKGQAKGEYERWVQEKGGAVSGGAVWSSYTKLYRAMVGTTNEEDKKVFKSIEDKRRNIAEGHRFPKEADTPKEREDIRASLLQETWALTGGTAKKIWTYMFNGHGTKNAWQHNLDRETALSLKPKLQMACLEYRALAGTPQQKQYFYSQSEQQKWNQESSFSKNFLGCQSYALNWSIPSMYNDIQKFDYGKKLLTNLASDDLSPFSHEGYERAKDGKFDLRVMCGETTKAYDEVMSLDLHLDQMLIAHNKDSRCRGSTNQIVTTVISLSVMGPLFKVAGSVSGFLTPNLGRIPLMGPLMTPMINTVTKRYRTMVSHLVRGKKLSIKGAEGWYNLNPFSSRNLRGVLDDTATAVFNVTTRGKTRGQFAAAWKRLGTMPFWAVLHVCATRGSYAAINGAITGTVFFLVNKVVMAPLVGGLIQQLPGETVMGAIWRTKWSLAIEYGQGVSYAMLGPIGDGPAIWTNKMGLGMAYRGIQWGRGFVRRRAPGLPKYIPFKDFRSRFYNYSKGLAGTSQIALEEAWFFIPDIAIMETFYFLQWWDTGEPAVRETFGAFVTQNAFALYMIRGKQARALGAQAIWETKIEVSAIKSFRELRKFANTRRTIRVAGSELNFGQGNVRDLLADVGILHSGDISFDEFYRLVRRGVDRTERYMDQRTLDEFYQQIEQMSDGIEAERAVTEWTHMTHLRNVALQIDAITRDKETFRRNIWPEYIQARRTQGVRAVNNYAQAFAAADGKLVSAEVDLSADPLKAIFGKGREVFFTSSMNNPQIKEQLEKMRDELEHRKQKAQSTGNSNLEKHIDDALALYMDPFHSRNQIQLARGLQPFGVRRMHEQRTAQVRSWQPFDEF